MSRRKSPKNFSSDGKGADAITSNPRLKILTPVSLTAFLLVVVAAFTFSVRPISDSDFWHHIALGRIITEQGRFPASDELSSTAAGRPWISSGWLPAVALYNMYKLSPSFGPALLVSLVITLMGGLVFFYGMRRTGNASLAAGITIAVLAACAPRFLPRPDIFSQLMLPLFLLLLFWYDARPLQVNGAGWLRMAAMSVLFIAWANLHMLFVIGLGLFAVYVAMTAWSSRQKPREDLHLLTGVLIVSILACLATPYGWRAIWFIWENAELHNAAGRINELKPLWSAIGQPGAEMTFIMLGIWLAAASWLLWRGNSRRTMPMWRWAFIVILIALALIQRRQIALAVPGITMLALSGWNPVSAAAPGRIWRHPVALIVPVILFLAQAAGYVSAGILLSPQALIKRGGPGVDCEWYPCEAVEFLRRNPPPEKFFHDLYSGSFLAYQLAPKTHVFIDGRLEVYNNGTFDDFFAPPEGRMSVEQLLNKYGVKSALLDWRAAAEQPGHTAAILSQLPQWDLCWFSDHYALFVREDQTTQPYLSAHGYKFLNPLFPQAFMDALADPATVAAAKAEAQRALKDNPNSHLAQKAMEVSGQ